MKKPLAWLRKKALDLGLWLLFVASTFLMLKSSTDPRPVFIKGTWAEAWFAQFPTGNQVTFDITVGVIVSLFVYVLVVRLPEHAKRKRLKAILSVQYQELKRESIYNFLFACNYPAGSDTVDELLDRDNFRSFFKEQVSSDQTRWDAVANGLDDYKVESLLLALDSFRREVEYTLTVIDVSDPKAFESLRHLTRVLHSSRRWADKNDQLKQLSRFFWTMHTGWSFVDGYSDRDFVAEMLEAV